MAILNKIVESPAELCAKPPAGNRGGPGVYDGLNNPNLPKRTGNSGVPEKILEGQAPMAQDKES